MYDTATGAGWGIAASKGITGGRKGYKASLFEGGIGVPFIARWPGKIEANAIDDESLMSGVDLLPTFCEIAGAELPDSYEPDGLSQVNTLLGEKYPSREKALFWHFDAPWPARKGSPDHWVSYAVVYQNWKMVSNKDASYFELYDISKDVGEEKDLKKRKPEVLGRLTGMLEEWKRSLPEKPTGDVFSSERDL